MWKGFNRFYRRNLKSEAGLLFFSKNINQIPTLRKVGLNCVPHNFSGTKGTLLTLSALQLISNKKSLLVSSRKSTILTKVRKGQPIGSRLVFTSEALWQFFNSLTNFVIPQLDLIQLFRHQKKSSDFKFFIKSPMSFAKLGSFFYSFQFLPPIQVTFTFKKISNRNKFFFLRLLKLPVSLSEKSR
jgi:ribosomal protein L5